MSSGLPTLIPRLILGLRPDVKGNAQFLTDDEVIYPAGGVLVVHNFPQKRQKFIKLSDKGRNVTSIVLSPHKNLIAVVESGPKPSVTLWCPITYKKKRVISLSAEREVQANRIACAAFTFDNRQIVIVTGEPDWTLYAFRTDKGKLETSTKALNNNNTGIVHHIACNPNDANLLVLAGDNLIRLLACSDYNWRQFGFCKGEGCNFTSVAWISQERLLIGTFDGRILALESGDLKYIFNAKDLVVMDLKPKDDLQQISQTSFKVLSETDLGDADVSVRSLRTFPRGFAFGFTSGLVHLFEMETPTRFTKRSLFRIPDHTIIREFEEETSGDLTRVNAISISPDQGKILVTCQENQIYTATLWMQDANSKEETLLTEFGYHLHNGAIGSIAVCSWKPLLLSSGEQDRTLKLWNYETEDLELMQKFQDDIFGVALHPTGLYAIVGFSDKLRFLTIMIDEFVITREFPVRVCRQCNFSKMGAFFAACNGNVIQIYCSTSFELIYNLKGHSGKITGISWTKDDKKLSSCGNEGAVYEWIVAEQKRLSELVIKQFCFLGTAITSDGRSVFVVSSDGHIREIISANINRDICITSSGLDSILLSHIDSMLFASGNSGSVYSIKIPLLEKAEFLEYNMHSDTVSNMILSFDDRYLMTASKDGSICIWKLGNSEGKAVKPDKDFQPSTDILISKQVLEDKMNQTKNLMLRLQELETEYAYQLRQNDTVNSLRMQEIHAGYCTAIEELKEKNNQLEQEHAQEIHDIDLGIKQMRKEHEQDLKNMEATYNEKLIVEYEKYQRLEDKMRKMREGYERELFELRRAKVESEESITNSFLEKLEERDVRYEELVQETAHKTKSHELIKQQIEEDADREIYDLRTGHAKDLREEQEINVKIRGELSMVKKKLILAQKESDDLKTRVNTMDMDLKKYKKSIIGLEKDVSDLKKEIAERDATIQDKEKRIFDLKNKNQELDKYKFILEFKIKELKSQIEPREHLILEQTEQINAMVKELENLQKVILSLDLQLHELREKLSAADGEVRKEIDRNLAMKRALKRIKTDLYGASGFVQNIPLLVKTVKEMFHKFNIDEEFELGQKEDSEVRSEFLRQREFLERTVNVLQAQVNKSTSNMSSDKMKLTEENATLLVETNMLRKELKDEQKRKDKLQSILGFNQRYVTPKQALEAVKNATETRTEIKRHFRKQIMDNERKIQVLKEENERLLGKVLVENNVERLMLMEEDKE